VAPAASDPQKPLAKDEKTIKDEKAVPAREEPSGKTGV